MPVSAGAVAAAPEGAHRRQRPPQRPPSPAGWPGVPLRRWPLPASSPRRRPAVPSRGPAARQLAAWLGPQLGLPGQELGLLALPPGLGAALLRLVLSACSASARPASIFSATPCTCSSLSARCTAGSSSVFSSRACWRKAFCSSFSRSGKASSFLGRASSSASLRAQLPVVLRRFGDEALGLGIPPEDREEVLLLKAGMQLKLSLELGEQPLAGLHRAVRGFGKLGEQLVRPGRAGQHQCSEGHAMESISLPQDGRGGLKSWSADLEGRGACPLHSGSAGMQEASFRAAA